MTLTKLKAKNQLTIPNEIIKKLHLKKNELFEINIEDDCIKLTPVDVEPRYSAQELKAIDLLVEREKKHAKSYKAGKEFSDYIKKITK